MNNVKSVDVSKLSTLSTLIIDSKKLTNINLKKNKELQSLYFDTENLKSIEQIDLSNILELYTLKIKNNPIKTVNLPSNLKISDVESSTDQKVTGKGARYNNKYSEEDGDTLDWYYNWD
ncbi:MAG: hypothetical protein K6G88_06470 [Lachnospiraceae bacterium]|nr:hypothetical protein [Lachnospiraceae bacterium]